MKQQFIISAFKVNNKKLFKMREKVKELPINYFYDNLPEYSINTEFGNIIRTEYYHQYTGMVESEDNKEDYYMFDIHHYDPMLDEEINNCGLDNFFDKYNWLKIFNSIEYNIINDIQLLIYTSIVIDIEYYGTYDEVEIKMNVVGYLDKNLNIIKV